MEKLDKVIAALDGCTSGMCRDGCPYDGDGYCKDRLMRDALEVLRTLHEDVIDQSGTILYLNRDLERCRAALNAQGEYAYLGGDLISREALIEKIEEIDWHSTNTEGVLHSGAANEESAYFRYADVAKVVAEARAVESEPVVHAHWECECEPYCFCSNCHHKFSLFDRVPRCPNCGAHMDEISELRTCYCPLCDKHFEVRSNESSGHCPDCGHHVVLRELEVTDGT